MCDRDFLLILSISIHWFLKTDYYFQLFLQGGSRTLLCHRDVVTDPWPLHSGLWRLASTGIAGHCCAIGIYSRTHGRVYIRGRGDWRQRAYVFGLGPLSLGARYTFSEPASQNYSNYHHFWAQCGSRLAPATFGPGSCWGSCC